MVPPSMSEVSAQKSCQSETFMLRTRARDFHGMNIFGIIDLIDTKHVVV
ncbi:hypothetical protein T12_7971 [Trichinella patagoniensis]|uniref:Uncharacterized protein n=1 Tax=Trichinella patagoniensis TaxID=990121 RepID=A0A0V0YYA0_9BILA|nr:hypothetical protein T12_7971 [Trichinella patagoniensis]